MPQVRDPKTGRYTSGGGSSVGGAAGTNPRIQKAKAVGGGATAGSVNPAAKQWVDDTFSGDGLGGQLREASNEYFTGKTARRTGQYGPYLSNTGGEKVRSAISSAKAGDSFTLNDNHGGMNSHHSYTKNDDGSWTQSSTGTYQTSNGRTRKMTPVTSTISTDALANTVVSHLARKEKETRSTGW